MDEHAQRTMFYGIAISLAIYVVSFAAVPLLPEGIDRTISIALLAGSVALLAGWWLAVRRGFRIGRAPGRAERRAKGHLAHEKEKRARLR